MGAAHHDSGGTVKKRSHKNDKRRLTARERVNEWFSSGSKTPESCLKMVQAHARETLARYKAKR